MNLKPLKEKGNCDACVESIDVVLYELHGMKMCDSCAKLDIHASELAIAANGMIQASREVDATIEIKPDVFNAETVAIHQVMGAIQHDVNIPDSDKNFVMAKTCMEHFQTMQKAIFEEKQEFAEKMRAKENAMRAWQVQVHTFASRVEDARKETFKNFDISYTPKPAKITKSTTTSTASKSKKPTKVELFDASKKYGVPMAAVAFLASSRNMTADQAAHHIADTKREAAAKSVESTESVN